MRFVHIHQKKNQPFFLSFLSPVFMSNFLRLRGFSLTLQPFHLTICITALYGKMGGAFQPLIITCFSYILIGGDLHA